MTIDREDLLSQRRIHLYKNNRWGILGYCPGPSVTMVNLDTGERIHFGLGGTTDDSFEPINATFKRSEIPRRG